MIKKISGWWMTAGFFCIATIAMTYPLAIHWKTDVRDVGDPILTSWIMAWNTQSVLSGWDLRNAPIYYPLAKMLFLSESLLPQSLLFAPFYIVTGNAIAGHNAVLLISIFLNGFITTVLAFKLGFDRRAALLSGIVYAFCPYFMRQLNHIQTVAAFGLPLFFLCVHLFFETKKERYLFGALLGFALQSLMHGYHIVYLTYFGGFYFISRWATEKIRWDFRRWIFWLTTATVVLGGLFGWYYQYRLTLSENGLSRWMDLPEVVGGSADLLNFFAVPPQNFLYGRLLAPFMTSEAALFPGIIVIVLTLIGLRWCWRQNTDKRLFFWMLCFSVALSWGPYIRLHGHNLVRGPYWFFAEWLPGWSLVRAPARLGVIIFFVFGHAGRIWLVAIVKSVGLQGESSRHFLRRSSACYWNIRVGLFRRRVFRCGIKCPPFFSSCAYRNEGPVLTLPTGFHADDTQAMYFLIPGFTELMNGYSGYEPWFSQTFFQELTSFPSAQSLATLQNLRVRFIAIDVALLRRIQPHLPFPFLPVSFELLKNEQGRELYRVPTVASRSIFLVGMEQADPGQKIDCSLVFPAAPACKDMASVQFTAERDGTSAVLPSRALTRCLSGKDGFSIISFQLELPKETGPLHLQAHVQDPKGHELACVNKNILMELRRFDSRNPDTFIARLDSLQSPVSVAAGAFFDIRVAVTNTGNTTWIGDVEDSEMRAVRFRGGEINGWLNPYQPFSDFSEPHWGATHLEISHWRRSGTPFIVREDDGHVLTARGYLGQNVDPGERGEFVMHAQAPKKPGTYLVKFNVVAEFAPLKEFGCNWDSSSASSPVVTLRVK